VLNQSRDKIVVPEDLVYQSQKVSIERCSKESLISNPISIGYILCPDIVIEWVHSGRGKVRIILYLEKIDEPQSKTKNEDEDKYEKLFFLLGTGFFVHRFNIFIGLNLVKHKKDSTIPKNKT